MTCQSLSRNFNRQTGWTWMRCNASVLESAKFCLDHEFARKSVSQTPDGYLALDQANGMSVMTFVLPFDIKLQQLAQSVADRLNASISDGMDLEHIASECNKLTRTVAPKTGGVTVEQYKSVIDHLLQDIDDTDLPVIVLENNFSMCIARELQRQRLAALKLDKNPAVAHLKLSGRQLSRLSRTQKRERGKLQHVLKQLEIDGLPPVMDRVIGH